MRFDDEVHSHTRSNKCQKVLRYIRLHCLITKHIHSYQIDFLFHVERFKDG